ncbi:hypothetical protein BT96DRAFT_1023407 [Gymnopus androsaceus JB14]|uniref:Uncharacterized protein n=1 Tax=Gymnopus androsaceus JB14 TaxID=1447944 RepID=A0A6A4H3X3_9AGAR|nr:hypothetical protein BT96DRAFT_1023407 [Gymnopus androsaceus JB14]
MPPNQIPRLRLDVDVIPDTIAANLATSLLGHVLFLKNQVPFPIPQLSRLPSATNNTNSKTNSRTTKLKRDLIDSFDTLSSHLDTTFTALSTAFARHESQAPAGAQAFLAILVGPSIGTPKSRVILAVDGLEMKSDESDEEEDVEEEAEAEGDSDESGSEPPESDDSDSNSSEESDTDRDNKTNTSTSTPASASTPSPNRGPPSQPLHQLIRTANQLLSRVLATADAEGRGMQDELAPTQTHILIRAPRRFTHPAWVPRCRPTLIATLRWSLLTTESGVEVEHKPTQKPKQKQKQKQRIQGVWVSGRTMSGPSSVISRKEDDSETEKENEGENERREGREGVKEEDEEDEMIWWSWGGKIVGFSSW